MALIKSCKRSSANNLVLAYSAAGTAVGGLSKDVLDGYKYIHVLTSTPSEYTGFIQGSPQSSISIHADSTSASGAATLTGTDIEISTLNVVNFLSMWTDTSNGAFIIELHN